ncbi:MAG: AAA family ATPase [Paludibacteraceae bacterium]|nr:AAA family ATPase [Paludibacteraceae bacterium]
MRTQAVNADGEPVPFVPNEGQRELIDKLGTFLLDSTEGKLFILRGYAGTGKTSIVSALVRTLRSLGQKCILMAPTGRAAKVLSRYASLDERVPAYTIHKYIYRQNELGKQSFSLGDNLFHHALFIVDEASMLSDIREPGSPFGSGCVLDDLMRFVYNGQGCSLMLVGDTAQLPPVGHSTSPALSDDYMARYAVPNLHISSHTLTEVARQADSSAILKNATAIREHISELSEKLTPANGEHVAITSAPELVLLSGADLQQSLEKSYNECGMAQTLIVTRSNKRTNLYNQGVRAYILWKEDQLSSGDRVMVNKNNYFWGKDYEGVEFIANGDMFEVTRIRNFRELYGFHFADATLQNVDYEAEREMECIVWLDILQAESDEQIYQMQQDLFYRIAEDYPEIHNKRELIKTIYDSPYYNALHIRYAYAVTCHKAQGGQWQHVYIDQGPVPDEQRDITYLRWLYTALTRATEQVYLINYE